MTLTDRFETFPRALAPGLWVLGNYYFNLYLVVGDQSSALIEVGVSAVAGQVIEQLESLRVTPTFLVVTHPHADHITGLDPLRETLRDALVVAGRGAPEFLAHPKAAGSIAAEDKHMTQFLESHGIVPAHRPVDEPPSLHGCMIASDGDEMDLGGRTLRFVEVKGHSPGKIVVHVPEISSLMLSDSLGFRYPGRGVFPLFLTDFADYMQTLDRLEAFNPAIVGVAHQGPVVGDEVTAAFREARSAAKSLRDRILNDTRPDDQLINDLFKEFYFDELTMYTEENIMNCARLVVKRARQHLAESPSS